MTALALSPTESYRRSEVLRILEQQCPFGVFETDADGTILNANDALLGILEMDRDELVGTRFCDHPEWFGEDWERGAHLHSDKLAMGTSGEFETRLTTPGGISKYVRISYYPVYNGVFLGVVGMVFDETTKKRVLAELFELKGEMADV